MRPRRDSLDVRRRLFADFVRAVVSGEIDVVRGHLESARELATLAADVGATRHDPARYFFAEISHYLYEGDTALHMAAAAFRQPIAAVLVGHGANCRARNRRGAEPLHYAADANHWDPDRQAETITYLLSIGADPNALNADGVAPLHRAVRTRSFAAVKALLDGGADPMLRNKNGSTPLTLASHTTGRSGSGSRRAREQQIAIADLLEERV